jgi:hypothetical protein
MVDGFHILIWNTTKKSLAIALSELGRGQGGDLTNVLYKPIWNCHNEFPLTTNIT